MDRAVAGCAQFCYRVRMRVIVDTDPGVDDAMALALMARAQLPIDTITTVYGNSVVANSTRNAGYIAHCLGAQWQIYQGAAKPLRGEGRLAKGCHGESGLGDFVPPDHMVLPAQPEPASAFFAKIAQGKEVYTLFCLGPLTNIAEAFIQNPGIVNNIGRLVIMGGAFSKQGNATKDAEFNVYNDPLAFQTVLNEAQQAEIDTTAWMILRMTDQLGWRYSETPTAPCTRLELF